MSGYGLMRFLWFMNNNSSNHIVGAFMINFFMLISSQSYVGESQKKMFFLMVFNIKVKNSSMTSELFYFVNKFSINYYADNGDVRQLGHWYCWTFLCQLLTNSIKKNLISLTIFGKIIEKIIQVTKFTYKTDKNNFSKMFE